LRLSALSSGSRTHLLQLLLGHWSTGLLYGLLHLSRLGIQLQLGLLLDSFRKAIRQFGELLCSRG
jgi:hypothetical protein